MLEQLKARYGTVPSESLVDGGFVGLQDFEKAIQMGTRIYAPVAKPKDQTRDPYAPLATDTPAIAAWRQRMGSSEAKEVYKERAASVECVNAQARNRGLQRFQVRGARKVRAVLLWFAIAHNLVRSLALQAAGTPEVSLA
jgi:hypothetical protein